MAAKRRKPPRDANSSCSKPQWSGAEIYQKGSWVYL